MPKIPIDFELGSYEDAAPAVANRRVLNCRPETNPGKNTKTIIRAIEGFAQKDVVAGRYLDHVVINLVTYMTVRDSAAAKLYSIDTSGNATLIGTMTNMGDATSVRMVTNGKNIVIVDTSGPTAAEDYYYDLTTTTLDYISNLDATYTGYGKAIDVEFKDGYYVFITASTIFHGDNVSVGSGLTFNAASVDVLPAEAGLGSAVRVANSQLYVFTKKKVLIYQTVSVTPFSFQRNVGFDLEFSVAISDYIISVKDIIFAIGKDSHAGTIGFHSIEGSTITSLQDSQISDNLLNGTHVYAYTLNSHLIVGYAANDQSPATRNRNFAIDYTETKLKGYPIWHQRDFTLSADNESITGLYPIHAYYSRDGSTGGTNQVFAIGRDETNDQTNIYSLTEGTCLNEASFFNAPATNERTFEYTFPLIRNSSDAIKIKRISLGFNENVSTAELLLTTDGTTFTSLGEIDLTVTTSKRGEWRRIGRFESDASFKVRFAPVSTSSPLVLVDGFLET